METKLDINTKLTKIKSEYDEKANAILTLHKAYEWFMKHLPFDYYHLDLRGGNTNPTIILATKDNVKIKTKKLQKDFESDISYPLFKKYLLTLGTAKSGLDDTYFYIQCNNDYALNNTNKSDIKHVIRNRCNQELFSHINKYFI